MPHVVNHFHIKNTDKDFIPGWGEGPLDWLHVATISYGAIREFVLAVHVPDSKPYLLETTTGTPRDVYDTEPDLFNDLERFVEENELLTVKQGMAGSELPFVAHPKRKKVYNI